MIPSLESFLADYRAEPLGRRREFSVCLPLYKTPEGYSLVYEVRSQIISQPGETSFPGGAIETGEHPREAARRETYEELGIPLEQIHILGALDYIVSESAVIYAYAALLEDYDPSRYQFNRAEVAAVKTVPVDWLLENPPTYYALPMQAVDTPHFPWNRIPGGRSYQWNRRRHSVAFYPYPENGLNIWGFTAVMTDNFVQIIDLVLRTDFNNA